MTDDTQTPALPVLNAAQARALGCLIEKEATTPDAYPLTVNATQVAANQKTAREPVLHLSAGDVHHALRQLETLGLAQVDAPTTMIRGTPWSPQQGEMQAFGLMTQAMA